MSGVHKHPTISFRVSDREREMIEARILASGMQKKDYFVRSCIYNRICVVGKKEVIYKLVEELYAPVVPACIFLDGHHSDHRGVAPPVCVPRSCFVRILQMQGEYCESACRLECYP